MMVLNAFGLSERSVPKKRGSGETEIITERKGRRKIHIREVGGTRIPSRKNRTRSRTTGAESPLLGVSGTSLIKSGAKPNGLANPKKPNALLEDLQNNLMEGGTKPTKAPAAWRPTSLSENTLIKSGAN
jgi:hypothetical protein